MPSTQTFLPIWASPPGETIRAILDERAISLNDFGAMVGLSPEEVATLLRGSKPISLRLARQLANTVGATTEFWMTRDCQYQDDLERIDTFNWINELPTKQMEQFGWIGQAESWIDTASACFNFFGVHNHQAWSQTYGDLTETTRFRTSNSIPATTAAVATWLRQGEIQASQQVADSWDPQAFRASLASIKRLTRAKDPQVFIPRLTHICASSGVRFVALPAPRGCPVSGAVRFISANEPAMFLSARYRSDDHFWFTFFHEAGHILLHDPKITYIDSLTNESDELCSLEEEQANIFAAQFLLPMELLEHLPRRRLQTRDIIALARKAGVAPGVIVGQLQHTGRLGYENLNGLKRRYRWVGTNLERA